MNIETVGVVGQGLLGRGIAACLLGHGFRVVAFSRKEATHHEARKYISRAMDDLVRRAGFADELAHQWAQRYEPVTSLEPLAGADFVIESVVEDMHTKQEVFDQLDPIGICYAGGTATSAPVP
jgi:3-hydroxyacyl-CoA dehydrogenase